MACLDKVYSRDDECRINVIDKVIFQNWKDVSVFKLMERVTEWEINVGVLKSRFNLNLLDPSIIKFTADVFKKICESYYLDMLKARDLKMQKDQTLRKRGIVKRSPMKGDVDIQQTK